LIAIAKLPAAKSSASSGSRAILVRNINSRSPAGSNHDKKSLRAKGDCGMAKAKKKSTKTSSKKTAKGRKKSKGVLASAVSIVRKQARKLGL
jgi:hypothetical protein